MAKEVGKAENAPLIGDVIFNCVLRSSAVLELDGAITASAEATATSIHSMRRPREEAIFLFSCNGRRCLPKEQRKEKEKERDMFWEARSNFLTYPGVAGGVVVVG